jgi:hypothetical protein
MYETKRGLPAFIDQSKEDTEQMCDGTRTISCSSLAVHHNAVTWIRPSGGAEIRHAARRAPSLTETGMLSSD